MRIAIVGAGIGGCSLALCLHDAGFDDIDLFESAAEFRELGVGINVLPHAARELSELGLADRNSAGFDPDILNSRHSLSARRTPR